MDIVKTLKDAITFVQKSDNVDMLQKLTQVKQEVIDMEDQIYNLKAENRELKENQKMTKNIERYQGSTLITLKSDNPKIPYCSTCYGKDNKLIQLNIKGDLCQCFNCKSYFYFSALPNGDKLKNMFK